MICTIPPITEEMLQALFYATWSTILFSWVLYIVGGLGITAGAHRLWAHKSYKATPFLRG